MTLLLALVAVIAAAVAGWRCCTVLVVEKLRDELDQAVTDGATLMQQKVALLEHSGPAGRRVLTLAERGAQATELRRALGGGTR